MKLNCITITTDASHCPETKASGWAFRIKWTGGQLNKSGQFKNRVNTSGSAERMAICNALYCLEQLELRSKLVVINTDYAPIVGKKYKTKGAAGSANRFIYNVSRRLKKKGISKIEYRHVKAHTSVRDNRSSANRWCDIQARKHMRIQRKTLKQ